MGYFIRLILHLKAQIIRHRLWKPFIEALRDPRATQARVLTEIIAANQHTTFGKKHQFDSIGSYQDFIRHVPVQTYEDLRHYIERQETEKHPHLTAATPIMYAQTSGTTGQPKFIPILKETLLRYQRSQEISTYCNFTAIPGLYDGKILAIVSPAVEGHFPTGTPFGSMSGLIYQTMPGFIRSRYLIPMPVFEIADHELKYYVIAAFALAEKSISFVASANPSTFLKIASVIEKNHDSLLNDIETGTIPSLKPLDQTLSDRIQSHFRKNKQRACELRTLFTRNDPIPSSRIWPNLKAIATWLDGSCAVFVPALRQHLHSNVKLIEMGYLASEFRGSLTVDPIENQAVPTIHENFFEFVERDEYQKMLTHRDHSPERETTGPSGLPTQFTDNDHRKDGSPKFLTLDQIELGRPYYVIVTTRSGLYRYFINDVVIFDGQYARTPTLHFLEKGTGVTNITGEKLHENQITQAMNELFADLGIDYRFFLMVADEEASHYVLYLEDIGVESGGIARRLETRLASLNLEFKNKRDSGRLGATAIQILKDGTGESFKRACLDAGQREAQFKFPCLVSKSKLDFNIADWVKH